MKQSSEGAALVTTLYSPQWGRFRAGTWSCRVLLGGFILAMSLAATAGCAEGPAGRDGLACWDLDGDGTGDVETEDTNGDGVVNVEDCRGSDGKTALMIVDDDLEGVCAHGGKKISTGVDDNGDGVLGPEEIDRSDYFCFDAGAGGGLSSLLAVVNEPPGANCPTGGKRIESGLDANANGLLEPGEVDQVSYLCGGKLTDISAEPPGANCASGGLRVATGSDDDGDGVLQAGEADTVEYVCHGASGSDGGESLVSVTPEPAGANCAAGGSLVRSGIDANDNGTLDPAEVDHSAFICAGVAGEAAPAALVRVDVEPAGPNCNNGGSAIFAGVDNNGNGNLDAGEITYTSYVCNGTAGPSGGSGSDALIRLELELPGANCAQGGVAIHAGVDLNGNNALDPGEETSTQYLCHGQDGTASACDEGEIRYVVCGVSNTWEQRQVCDGLSNWVNVGSCQPPGSGDGTCPVVSLGMTEITSTAPTFSCLNRSTVVYDGEIWVIDGNIAHHSPDGVNWTTEPAAPFADRCYHAAVVHAGKIFVISGKDASSTARLQDVWSYQTGVGWVLEQGAAPFAGRRNHTAVSFGGGIYLIGGDAALSEYEDDVWFSADGVTWSELTQAAPFGDRDGHMAAAWNNGLWVAGRPDDVWRTSNGEQWVQETISAGWGASRWGGSMLGHAGRLWVMGWGSGYDEIWFSDDGRTWCKAADLVSFLATSTVLGATVEFAGSMYAITPHGRVYSISVL